MFIRDLASGRFQLLCHMGSKFYGKISKERTYLRSTYKDPTRLLSHNALRGNIARFGPELVRKLIGRAGSLNSFGLENEERILLGDAMINKLDIDQYCGEEDKDSGEAGLSAGTTDSEGENPSIDENKLKLIFSTVKKLIFL